MAVSVIISKQGRDLEGGHGGGELQESSIAEQKGEQTRGTQSHLFCRSEGVNTELGQAFELALF